jgi:hypothetical protein
MFIFVAYVSGMNQGGGYIFFGEGSEPYTFYSLSFLNNMRTNFSLFGVSAILSSVPLPSVFLDHEVVDLFVP